MYKKEFRALFKDILHSIHNLNQRDNEMLPDDKLNEIRYLNCNYRAINFEDEIDQEILTRDVDNDFVFDMFESYKYSRKKTIESLYEENSVSRILIKRLKSEVNSTKIMLEIIKKRLDDILVSCEFPMNILSENARKPTRKDTGLANFEETRAENQTGDLYLANDKRVNI